MYHFYRGYGDADYLVKKLLEYKAEPHSITIPITSVVTMSPMFFRNELEIGLVNLGVDFSLRAFLREENVEAFETLVLFPILELLGEYARNEIEGAQMAVEAMISLLKKVTSQDDTFPDYQIGLIEDEIKKVRGEV